MNTLLLAYIALMLTAVAAAFVVELSLAGRRYRTGVLELLDARASAELERALRERVNHRGHHVGAGQRPTHEKNGKGKTEDLVHALRVPAQADGAA